MDSGSYRRDPGIGTGCGILALSVGMRTLAPNHQRWSEEEQREIARLQEACRAVDFYRLECNETDEGDPWCSVCDDRNHTVAVHIARIERRYIVVFQSSLQPLRMSSLGGAVDLILQQMMGMKRAGVFDDRPS